MRAVLIRLIPLLTFLVFSTATLLVSRHELSFSLLGLLLSLGISGLIHLLIRRVELFRRARDRMAQEAAAREEAQQALRDSEARYRSIFDSAHDGLVIMGVEGVIVEANRAAGEMHGRASGELRGLSYPELIVEQRRHLWASFQQQIGAVGAATLSSRHLRADGGEVELEVRGSSFSYGGEPRVLVILTDVTELRRSERRLAVLARKVLGAQEEERARISRELHDELGQLLTAARFELGLLGKHEKAPSPELSRAHQSSVQLIEKAAEELRRICKRLRPPLLDDLGLEPAVQQLVEEFVEHSGLGVELEISLAESESPLPTEVTLCTYRVLQESLTNVGRHASARHVAVSLRQLPTELVASIYDDGRGFEIVDLPSLEGSGITGMRERAGLVGGVVEIRSAPFQGTRVGLRVPLRDSFEGAT